MPSRLSMSHVVFALAIVFLVYVVALPIGAMFWQSLRTEDGALTLSNYANFFGNSRLLQSTLNTLTVSVITAIGSILIAAPLAFGVARTNMRGKAVVNIAVIISFASPPFLIALAYIF